MLDTLKKRPTDQATKRRAVEYMTSVTHSMEYTRATVKRLTDQMRTLLLELGPPNPGFEAVLAKLVA